MLGRSLFSLFRRTGTAHAVINLPNALSGYFELRVDRIVGSVNDAHGSVVGSMRIEVFLRGHRITSVMATPHPENQCFVFSMPVEGRFTGAELVKEEVIVLARDSEGNGGRLLLDGAAQIELIREYLGVPAVVIFDLDFSAGGNARAHLGAGWSGAEADFTFTEDDDSFVNFDTPAELGTYVLRITAGTVIYPPVLVEQNLEVFINSTQVAHIVYSQSHVQFREFEFPQEVFGDTARSVLRLHHPDAARPNDLGLNADRRRLAFNFKRLSLIRLLPSE